MKVLVVGGRLQGSEVTYLAKEAGWHVTLVDLEADVLASGLCDAFVWGNVTKWRSAAFKRFDLVIPATENLNTLLAVQALCAEAGVSFAFDEAAFRISSSKAASDELLGQIGIPTPPPIHEARDWQHGFIVKPDSESGSHGVRFFRHYDDAISYLEDHGDCIGQAFVDGPIYSVEVTCKGNVVRPHVVTEVVVGEDYDCFRIVAPADIPEIDERGIQFIAHRIGLALDMRGIFDVELVWCDGEPYVLEIDARMPSQTPIAIYHATGLNLVVELARCFVKVPKGEVARPDARPGYAVLEHVCLFDGEGKGAPSHVGEAQLSDSSAYVREDGFLGADVALVSRDDDAGRTFATLVKASETPITSAMAQSRANGKDECHDAAQPG